MNERLKVVYLHTGNSQIWRPDMVINFSHIIFLILKNKCPLNTPLKLIIIGHCNMCQIYTKEIRVGLIWYTTQLTAHIELTWNLFHNPHVVLLTMRQSVCVHYSLFVFLYDRCNNRWLTNTLASLQLCDLIERYSTIHLS